MRKAITAALFVGVGVTWAAAGQQRRGGEEASDLQQRVERLERRVAQLERLVASSTVSPRKSVRQAEQDLEAAEQRLEYCQRVGRKGYITPVRLAACTMEVEKARKQLSLAKGEAVAEMVAIEVAILEAKFRLTAGNERLRANEKMAATGLATQVQVNAAKLAVERAQADLNAAQQRLKQYRGSVEPKR